MTLAAGTKLGPYEILAPVGAGGMGEVYKARDTRLDRSVAIKVLSPRLSSSPEVRQRFEREAKTVSQLSHPHICALYDVGREGDTEYLVMELLEGETLTERLAKGPLPLDQTLRYGTEIADALERAHRQGIVHRDLKPGNVMLTKSGVKLLDFGLAKAMATPTAQSTLTSLPTQQGLTQEGTILGTFQYMAPEQLEGKDADGRTDIFAFGATLYEMATGRKAFAASSQASLITAIMSSDPAPISSVQPMSPPALDRVVRKCLAKDPVERWQSASDLGSELQWIRESSGVGAPVAAGARPRRSSREALAWALAALAALVAGWALLRPGRGDVDPGESVALTLSPPPGYRFGNFFALSPDARSIAFAAEPDDSIWIRALDSTEARRLEGTAGARGLMWSPDSRSLAFLQDLRLRRIDAEGSAVQTICAPGPQMGGSWGADGRIVFSPGFGERLLVVPSSGGEPKPATNLDAARGDVGHFYPSFLPDSRHFVFVARNSDPEKTVLVLGDLDSKETRVLRRSDTAAAWSPLGYLLFAIEGNLLAQRFDARTLALSGEPFSVVKDVAFGTDSNRGGWTTSGRTLVYGTWPHDRSLAWIDRSGTVLGTLGAVAAYDEGLAISPDGRRVAVSVRDASRGLNTDVWVLDVATGTASRVSSERSDEFHPLWTQDGRTLVYTSDRAGYYDLYRRPADGGPEEKVLITKWDKIGVDVTPDGGSVLFAGSPKGEAEDLWLQPMAGGDARAIVQSDRFVESTARISPDGRHVAFSSDETGRAEIYLQPISGGARQRVSRTGGYAPVWRRDGRELFFISTDGRLMAVSLTPGSGDFAIQEPRPLFAVDIGDTHAFSPELYDVAPDGQRFLVIRRSAAEHPGLVVRLNWAADLPK
jgi:serine/threonine protein kinase/Tol biopolymer transport system component